MKQLIFTLFVFSLELLCVAQQKKIDYLCDKRRPTTVNQYHFDTTQKFVVLPSNYSSERVNDVNLEQGVISKIHYVYTTFSKDDDFDQNGLNHLRLEKLAKDHSELFKVSVKRWRVIRQKGCDSPETCKDYFHGFVVYFENNVTAEYTKLEFERLKRALEETDSVIKESKELYTIIFNQKKCREPYLSSSSERLYESLKKERKSRPKYEGEVSVEYDVNWNGRLKGLKINEDLGKRHVAFEKFLLRKMRFAPAMILDHKVSAKAYGKITFPINEHSFNIDSTIVDPNELSAIVKVDTNIHIGDCYACFDTDTTYEKIYENFEKKVVSEVLERNKWEQCQVVVDVTGSMYSYTLDLLRWIKLSENSNVEGYTFFNDGDAKSTRRKKIGSTGGVYSVKSNILDVVLDTLAHTMASGGGGDTPENNFEALLKAKKECPSCKNFVMIADNNAFPRDPKLLSAFKGQLRLILCGARYGIDTKYLDLAKRYKFTVHTIEDDLEGLYKLKEGETVEIFGETYTIKNGHFIKTRKT